ncbi:MAG TPA: ROK family protein [Hyphomonadaceae bacterium]|nr:ROK family protein [Hyphomonadaceae bacterium]
MGGLALFGGVDAGGTTFKCGLASAGGDLVARRRIPTTDPRETISNCVAFFLEAAHEHDAEIAALGIAAFGPIDVDAASPAYGTILDTPKRGWSGANLFDLFSRALGVRVTVDTDVNGALLAEMKWGAARDASSAAYVTIGTGIGAGIFAGGGFMGKPRHPEFGHICVQRHAADASFQGVCPKHGDCLEGLASASALAARFGEPAALPADHQAWGIEAWYIAQACLNLNLSFRPDRIILGGGLMLAEHLLPRVQERYAQLVAGYLGESTSDIERLICRPGLGDDAGLLGGVALARG